MERLTLTWNGKTEEIPLTVFRRMLSITRLHLRELERKEGAHFPQLDRETRNQLNRLQSKHTELI